MIYGERLVKQMYNSKKKMPHWRTHDRNELHLVHYQQTALAILFTFV